MSIKKVPLQDLELWPDEVICFSAYTDTRNPVQQRRTYVNGEKLQAENAKLREMVAQMYPRAKAFLQMGVQLGCNDTLSYDWELQMQELGVELPK